MKKMSKSLSDLIKKFDEKKTDERIGCRYTILSYNGWLSLCGKKIAPGRYYCRKHLTEIANRKKKKANVVG